MLTLLEFLEELDRSQQFIVLPPADVERLSRQFGDQVRSIGRWNAAGDGSIEIPLANLAQAVSTLGEAGLAAAVRELKTPDEFTGMLESSSAAAQLIGALSRLYLDQFEARVRRFQDAQDVEEVERLRRQISRDLFGA